MLQWAREQLYNRSSDEWSYDTLEADPLVHLLVEACASESRKIYESIEDTQDRLLQRLLKYLLPEGFHVPVPAAAIARARPRIPVVELSNTQRLAVKNEKFNLSFTPLFNTKLFDAKIRFIGTDNEILDQSDKPSYAIQDHPQLVSRLLLGIQTESPIANLKDMAFYIDWKGDTIEKRQLLAALAKSKWRWNGQILQRQNGFLDAKSAYGNQRFEADFQLAKKMNAQFKRNFHVITDETAPLPLEMQAIQVLQSWLKENPSLAAEAERQTEKWTELEGNFLWLRIELPYPVQLVDVKRHLSFALNHFIVVNRKLEIKDDTDTYFSRSLGTEAIEIAPKEGLFHSIERVVDQTQNSPIPALPLAKLLKQDSATAYSYRLGGIGRADNYTAWERLAYLLGVFRKEQAQQELADRLAKNMSLEELHEVMGHMISRQRAKQAAQKGDQLPIYLFVKHQEAQAPLRVRIQYWTDRWRARKRTCSRFHAGVYPTFTRLGSF